MLLVLPLATISHQETLPAEIVTEGQTPGNAFSICQDENATVRAVELSPAGRELVSPLRNLQRVLRFTLW